MKKTAKTRFTTEDVARMHGMVPVKDGGEEIIYAKCPYCGKYGVFSINRVKDVFRCPACEAAGNAITLHLKMSEEGKYDGSDGIKRAVRDIFRYMDENKVFEHRQEEEEERKLVPAEEKADPVFTDKVYRTMAGILVLSEKHKENIRGRGIDPENGIFLFCSVPEDPDEFIKILIKIFPDLSGVPGFYFDGKRWKMNLIMKDYAVKTGFFCFAFDENGLITGAQIRIDDLSAEASPQLVSLFRKFGMKKSDAEAMLDAVKKDPDKIAEKFLSRGADISMVPEFREENGHYEIKRREYPKYVWFSSRGKKKGSSSGAVATFLRGTTEDIVIVTEGILKADIIFVLLHGKVTVIGIPGVNSYKTILPFLEAVPQHCLMVECYDMDKELIPKNKKEEMKLKSVKGAEEKLVKLLKDKGYPVRTMRWNMDKDHVWKGEYKGLDDFLSAQDESMRQKFLAYLYRLRDEEGVGQQAPRDN